MNSVVDQKEKESDQEPQFGAGVNRSMCEASRNSSISSRLRRRLQRSFRGYNSDPSVFDTRTCVRVRTIPYVVFAYLMNACVAIAAAATAAMVSYPWCASETAVFWMCTVLAFVIDAAVVQPLVVGMTCVYRWIALDPMSSAGRGGIDAENFGGTSRSSLRFGATVTDRTTDLDLSTTTATQNNSQRGHNDQSPQPASSADTDASAVSSSWALSTLWSSATFELMPIDGSWRYVGPAAGQGRNAAALSVGPWSGEHSRPRRCASGGSSSASNSSVVGKGVKALSINTPPIAVEATAGRGSLSLLGKNNGLGARSEIARTVTVDNEPTTDDLDVEDY